MIISFRYWRDETAGCYCNPRFWLSKNQRVGICGNILRSTGRTYSQIASDGFQIQVLLMVLPVALLTLSYKYHNKRLTHSGEAVRKVESVSMA